MITVLVTGGRDYDNETKVHAVLDRILRDNPSMRLAHGGCGTNADELPIKASKFTGADKLAHWWAGARNVPLRRSNVPLIIVS